MKSVMIFLSFLFLGLSQTMAGEINILPAGPYCQASKSDLECLNKGQQASNVEEGKVVKTLLMAQIDYRTSNGELKSLSPALRVTYKQGTQESDIILTGESASKFGITMMELVDALRDPRSKILMRQDPETRIKLGVALAIIK